MDQRDQFRRRDELPKGVSETFYATRPVTEETTERRKKRLCKWGIQVERIPYAGANGGELVVTPRTTGVETAL